MAKFIPSSHDTSPSFIFLKEAVQKEFEEWTTTQTCWTILKDKHDAHYWDYLLLRNISCRIIYMANPLFNPHEAFKDVVHQQVIAIRFAPKDDIANEHQTHMINDCTTAFIVTDSSERARKKIEEIEKES